MPKRAQKRTLTQEQIVSRALELLESDGFDGVTMRRLADALGVKAASLYNHVRDKNELLSLMADTICAAIPDIDARLPWRTQAERMGTEVRRVLLARRDSARVLAATPPSGPNRFRLIEQVLAVMTAAGFAPSQVADASFVMSTYVIGFVLDETAVAINDAAEAEQMTAQMRAWFKSLPADRYPTIVALADHLVDSPPDRRFKLGVQAMLDGFELQLERRR